MMLTFALIALFSIAAVTAIAMLAWQVAAAAPKVADLKAALADCPQTTEFRFTVRETIVSPRHGQIVTLPIKIKALGSAQPLRAAA